MHSPYIILLLLDIIQMMIHTTIDIQETWFDEFNLFLEIYEQYLPKFLSHNFVEFPVTPSQQKKLVIQIEMMKRPLLKHLAQYPEPWLECLDYFTYSIPDLHFGPWGCIGLEDGELSSDGNIRDTQSNFKLLIPTDNTNRVEEPLIQQLITQEVSESDSDLAEDEQFMTQEVLGSGSDLTENDNTSDTEELLPPIQNEDNPTRNKWANMLKLKVIKTLVIKELKAICVCFGTNATPQDSVLPSETTPLLHGNQ
ncbi:hypothetical protein AX16_009110 [Volvariella volvacea WC 439]|nr:hypothetical protein AX16_009110 [Volvariella volvacea WC 439]